MMNPDAKAKWIAALRNETPTQYAQGYGRLYMRGESNEGGSYCCLGVLCDVFKKDTNSDDLFSPGGAWFGDRNVVGTVRDVVHVPNSVAHWAGLGMSARSVIEHLVRMNDSHMHGFKAIADYIDANL
jgi:hypothetical protein